MATVVQKIIDLYQEFENASDPSIRNHFVYKTPIPIAAIVVSYLYFVYHAGPRHMKNREPYNLKTVILCYNFVQVLVNFYFFTMGVYYWEHFSNVFCPPMSFEDPKLQAILVHFSVAYYNIKVLDLLDTVFFVLRKKQSHVSFLHVYHHTMMATLGWIGLRAASGGHVIYLGFFNSFVHFVMYLYYSLSMIDATKSLVESCKKYVTIIQLLQFVALFWIFTQSVFQPPHCRLPYGFPYLLLTQDFLMIYLFADFYYNTYVTPNRRKSKVQ